MLLPLFEPTSNSISKSVHPELPALKNSNLSVASRPSLFVLNEEDSEIDSLQHILGADFNISCGSTVNDPSLLPNQKPADLIICDFHSKSREIFDLLKRAEADGIPVLMILSDCERAKAVSWLQYGVADFICRPFEPSELRARVTAHLERSLARKCLRKELVESDQNLQRLCEEASFKIRELSRTNKLKDEFMAMLSHELRNPINVISGFAEVLLSNSEDPELAHEAAQAIYRNAQFQVKLVQDLMDVSRSIAGKMILDCKPIEIGSVLKEVLPTAQAAADSKGIKIFIQIKSSGLILGDFTRISQVVWNLLSNAIKFTPEGGQVDIEIQTHEQWIEFSVRDTGVGIDSNFLPYIFEQFHQQDRTITKNFGGLGLGLAIVKHIVELHHGSVSAYSEGAGHGATFTVRLPSLPN